MGRQSGLTLTETTIASLVLITGLVGVAGCFSYALQSSIRVRQQTTALALLSAKMEELKADVAPKPGRYSEVITNSESFLLMWEISSEVPHRVTVTVSRKPPGIRDTYEELGTASTLIGSRF